MSGNGSPSTYVIYTTLAEKAGMTVPELKRALRSKGYLRGHEVTEKAFRYRVAEIRKVADSRRRARTKDHYPVWDLKRVLRMLRRSRLTRDPRTITLSRDQYAQRLNEIAIELAHHLSGNKPGSAEQAAELLRDQLGEGVVHIVVDAVFEGGLNLLFDLNRVIRGEEDRFFITRQVIQAMGSVAAARPSPSKHLQMAESIHVGMEAFVERRIASKGPALARRKKDIEREGVAREK